MKKIIASCAALLLGGAIGSAHAGYIDYAFNGKFEYVDSRFVGSLTTDSVISGSVHFNEDSVTGVGFEQFFLGEDGSATLLIDVGGVLLDKTDDYGFSMMLRNPYVVYQDGIFSGVSFYYYPMGSSTSGGTVSFRLSGDSLDLLGNGFIDYGHGSVSYVRMPSVPVPSAAWLFASGILCLLRGARFISRRVN